MSSDASNQDGSPIPSPFAQSALNALIRARKRAEEIAAATGTAIVQWEDGRIVRIYPGRKTETRPGDAADSEPSG